MQYNIDWPIWTYHKGANESYPYAKLVMTMGKPQIKYT